MTSPANQRKFDTTLAFMAQVCMSKRMKRYAFACAEDLPADLRDKIVAYRSLMMAMAGAVVLLLIHARLWTLAAVVIVWVALWPTKSRQERELDTALAPYMESIEAKMRTAPK
ncbi:MAG: hypothetical protein EPN97_17025 [Alphaproteobacteria bacterium]|nr:MAG: hypothetical protein EPN97_17025 [Alphaproteobacteria bacterium]